jgi:hypothetical protein
VMKRVSDVLRRLSREKAFYFFTSIGNYTGESAASLKEFMDKINEVDAKSLMFHFGRGDFEKWIAQVLEDGELAEEIGKIRKSEVAGGLLRNRLYEVVSKRYKELTSWLRFTVENISINE